MSELKACPFCGPGNSIVECYQDDYGYWKVGCGACGSHSGHRPKTDPEAKAKVIAHWNQRPVSERLRSALTDIKTELERPGSRPPHLKRVCALAVQAALT